MEINYCVKCHSRVSSNEIENGDGLVTAENKVYCKQCVIDLGIVPEPAQGAQAARQTKGSGAAAPATARRSDHARPPVTGPAHSGAPARATSRMPFVLIGLLGMAALLILAIIILLLMQKPAAQPAQPQPAPQASATVKPAPPQPVTAPANPVQPAAQPAGQPRPAVPVAVPTATPAGLPATPAPAPGPGTEMLGADWQQRFEAVKGVWAWGPAGLAGTVGGDDGPGIMRSKVMWEHYEGAVSFAVSAPVTIECQIRLKDDLRGSILISDIKPGGWHSLAWRVAGVKLLGLTYDGRDVLAAPMAAVRCRVDGMASIGKVLLRFKPDGPEPMQAVLGSFTVKPLTFEDVAAAFPPLPDGAAVPGNLVPGGGLDQAFNHKFNGWSSVDAPGTAAFRDPFIRHGGTASVRIEDCHLSNSTSNSRLWMNDIPVQPNTVYRVSFWARTECADFASIGIEIIKNGDGLANFSNIPKTTEWRECTFTFNAGTGGTVKLVLGVWNGKAGRVWFDDVVVVPADAAAAPVLGAGGPAGWTNFMAGNSVEAARKLVETKLVEAEKLFRERKFEAANALYEDILGRITNKELKGEVNGKYLTVNLNFKALDEVIAWLATQGQLDLSKLGDMTGLLVGADRTGYTVRTGDTTITLGWKGFRDNEFTGLFHRAADLGRFHATLLLALEAAGKRTFNELVKMRDLVDKAVKIAPDKAAFYAPLYTWVYEEIKVAEARAEAERQARILIKKPGEAFVKVGQPASVPGWARTELDMYAALHRCFGACVDKFIDETTGKPCAQFEWATADDVGEGVATWDRTLILTGDKRLIAAYTKLWQYLYKAEHDMGGFANGFYAKPYDWEHIGELMQLHWGALDLNPGDKCP
ncbi:MAG: carbohydrate binding domain-containing protein [Planctomycetota bacterium]